MRFQILPVVAALVLPLTAVALPANTAEEVPAHLRAKRSFVVRDGVERTIFEHAASGATIDFVTHSGICETTPGANQYSGYVSVGSNQNMWFWFFEARHNASTAPLAAWFNGGPGCSSMIGLFQENGPCQFYDGASTPSLNPYSFNEYANMIYIDQPIGAGFSYGTETVTSTATAASYVYALLQAFYANFPQYSLRIVILGFSRNLMAGTMDQNKKSGTIEVPLVALGINNAWLDPAINYKYFIDYAYNNTYKPLISTSRFNSLTSYFNNKCLPALKKCTGLTGTDQACIQADNICEQIEETILNAADFDAYDVRQSSQDPYPPETYVNYLSNAAVTKAIGAKSEYAECSDSAGDKFNTAGDDARSLLSTLSEVVQTGISVLIWAGDADWICNWFGNIITAEAVSYSQATAFKAKAVADFKVNGVAKGTFKNVGNLSWLRIFGAGHEVMYYQPEVSLQVFKQIMQKEAISST
ncbi:hypothetical protein HYALB_00011545 [Hymenoscyphus albidus]|uniref:Uncharacterized protein n=1 Tax=Hymenoscyphus albidus TaxID=595503 RepID=A0A9N9Q1D9_9HELO|nr:hypothetical protein HYALB_00011545 [Hymenoscyphus albidus]